MHRILLLAVVLAAGALGESHAQQTGAARPATLSVPNVQRALQAYLPTGVTVGALQLTGSKAVFTGTAKQNAQLSQFMRALDASGQFVNLDLMEIAQRGGAYEYRLALVVSCDPNVQHKPGSLCGPAGKAPSVFKCRVNGTVTFQAKPCAPGQEA
jgi:hypothetical protein